MTRGPVEQVHIVASTNFFSTSSATFVDVPIALVKITIPDGPNQLVVARFTAEAACRNSDTCSVRIMANGGEMRPNSGSDFLFSHDIFTAHAGDRSAILAPGAYTIHVSS